MARRFRLRIRGRRNALGLWQGQRSDPWQSGTTPSLAVHFRSNSHTMPNYRLPPTPAIHEATCPSATCKQKAKEMLDNIDIKMVARLAQRVQREATGYYCGYTFKGQVVGRKFLLQASKSFDSMTDKLDSRSDAQRMHSVTNRCFSDMHHRCCARPTAEEWNLATFWDDQDVTNAEFQRTFMSCNFPGGQLVRRLEDEMERASNTVTKVIPSFKEKDDIVMIHFPDLYGYRGKHEDHFIKLANR